MSDPPPVDPALEWSWRQVLPVLVLGAAMPVVVFVLLTRYGVPILWALIAGGLFPAVGNIRAWLRARRVQPLGIIVMSLLAIGAAISAITGSVFVALIKESFVTASFGVLCLASLLAERPLLFYINRQFVAGDDPARLAWWNGLWQSADFRAAHRLVTAVWGVAYLIEALVRVGLALTLTAGQVLALSHAMAFGVLIVLIAWTRRHLLALRERRLRAQQPA